MSSSYYYWPIYCKQMDYAVPMTCVNRRWPTLIRFANRETDYRFASLPSNMYVDRTT